MDTLWPRLKAYMQIGPDNAMNKFYLPPRAALANKMLIVILVLSTLALLVGSPQGTDSVAVILGILAFRGLLIVGATLKYPATYSILMGSGLLAVAAALNKMNPVAVLCEVIGLALAFYVRTHIYVRTPSPENADAGQTDQA